MATNADGRQLLPVACTLGPADGAQRLNEWREVATVAGAGRELGSGKLTLRFRDAIGIGTELERLVAAERDCCAFLGWALVRNGPEWHVEVTGNDDDLRALALAE